MDVNHTEADEDEQLKRLLTDGSPDWERTKWYPMLMAVKGGRSKLVSVCKQTINRHRNDPDKNLQKLVDHNLDMQRREGRLTRGIKTTISNEARRVFEQVEKTWGHKEWIAEFLVSDEPRKLLLTKCQNVVDKHDNYTVDQLVTTVYNRVEKAWYRRRRNKQ